MGHSPMVSPTSDSLLHLDLRTPALVSASTTTLPFSALLWNPALGGFSHSDPNGHPIMDLSTSVWASSKTEEQCFLFCSGKSRSEWITDTKEKAVIKSDMQSIFERFCFLCHRTLFKKCLAMFLKYIFSSLPWFFSRAV